MGEMAAAVRLQRMLTVLVLRFVGGCVGVWVVVPASDVHVRLFLLSSAAVNWATAAQSLSAPSHRNLGNLHLGNNLIGDPGALALR